MPIIPYGWSNLQDLIRRRKPRKSGPGCPKCRSPMVIELTYWYCPVCGQKYAKQKPKRDYQRPDDEQAANLRRFRLDVSDQTRAPLGHFEPPKHMYEERFAWMISALVVYLCMPAGFDEYAGSDVSYYNEAIGTLLIVMFCMAAFTLIGMFSGNLSTKTIVAWIICLTGVPVILLELVSYPYSVDFSLTTRRELTQIWFEMIWLVLALIQTVWAVWYLFREERELRAGG